MEKYSDFGFRMLSLFYSYPFFVCVSVFWYVKRIYSHQNSLMTCWYKSPENVDETKTGFMTHTKHNCHQTNITYHRYLCALIVCLQVAYLFDTTQVLHLILNILVWQSDALCSSFERHYGIECVTQSDIQEFILVIVQQFNGWLILGSIFGLPLLSSFPIFRPWCQQIQTMTYLSRYYQLQKLIVTIHFNCAHNFWTRKKNWLKRCQLVNEYENERFLDSMNSKPLKWSNNFTAKNKATILLM